MRMVRGYLSKDLVHIESISGAIDRLVDSNGARVVFLGNSLVREGIVKDQLVGHLSETTPVSVAQVYPDATNIGDWLEIYRHHVTEPRNGHEVLIVGFAEDHLTDASPVHVRQLAQNYTTWNAAMRLFKEESLSFDSRAEFLLARYSTAFANAERVHRRVLERIIPYYRVSAARMNETNPGQRTAEAPRPTYRRLKELIRLTNESNVRMVVVAFPVGSHYELDAGLPGLLKQSGVTFVDAREFEGITPDMFPDGYHMNDAAAMIFSVQLAARLQAAFAWDALGR